MIKLKNIDLDNISISEQTTKVLEEDKKVIFKEWGVFEKRETKSRKIKMPMWEEERYTEPKKVIKFRAGKGLVKMAEGDADE